MYFLDIQNDESGQSHKSNKVQEGQGRRVTPEVVVTDADVDDDVTDGTAVSVLTTGERSKSIKQYWTSLINPTECLQIQMPL